MSVKDFDVLREQRIGTPESRTFVIVGEQFVAKASVKPEMLTKYENVSTADSSTDTMATIDELVLSMIEPGDGDWVDDPRVDPASVPEGEQIRKVGTDHARYLRLRAVENGENVLSIGDLREITEWLVERQTGRPTGLRSSSLHGREGTGDGSTARSSLRVAGE